jgi:protein-disulfide isomerase
MVVEPPQPDYAAVDAAWQTSLAEQERLIVGDPDAPIKMREYLSFTCGHCVRYSRSIERLIALEVEEGRVQYEASALAGDELARNATLATYCATEQGKGFTVSEALFQGYMVQGPEAAYSRDGLNDLLGDLELDMDALNGCMDGGKYDHLLEAVSSDFYDRGLTGTPTLLLGAGDDPLETLLLPDGQIWSGTIPLHYLRDMFRLSIEEGKPFSDFFNQ